MKFYTRVAKGLKLEVRKFGGLILMFLEVTGKKLAGWAFLNRINMNDQAVCVHVTQFFILMILWCNVIISKLIG